VTIIRAEHSCTETPARRASLTYRALAAANLTGTGGCGLGEAPIAFPYPTGFCASRRVCGGPSGCASPGPGGPPRLPRSHRARTPCVASGGTCAGVYRPLVVLARTYRHLHRRGPSRTHGTPYFRPTLAVLLGLERRTAHGGRDSTASESPVRSGRGRVPQCPRRRLTASVDQARDWCEEGATRRSVERRGRRARRGSGRGRRR
jgi:hypothetical protein